LVAGTLAGGFDPSQVDPRTAEFALRIHDLARKPGSIVQLAPDPEEFALMLRQLNQEGQIEPEHISVIIHENDPNLGWYQDRVKQNKSVGLVVLKEEDLEVDSVLELAEVAAMLGKDLFEALAMTTGQAAAGAEGIYHVGREFIRELTATLESMSVFAVQA
jgi:hypothetical protein